MSDSGYDRFAGLLGGIARAGLAVAGAAVLALWARPHIWLEIVVFLWAMPPAVVLIACAGELAQALSEKLLVGQPTWKWTVRRRGRRSLQHFS